MPKILLSSPVRGIKGKFKQSDVCYFVAKNGLTYARSAGEVSNPRTTQQQTVRSLFTVASRYWSSLTAAQRSDWEDYAYVYYDKSASGEPVIPSGKAAFTKANMMRQILGLAIVSAAPTEGPPLPLTTMEQVITPNEDQLYVKVTHSIAATTGLQVVALMTPAMRSVAEKPRKGEMRYACGLSAASGLALSASGQNLEFDNTVYTILDGQRYGVELRVVRTADGISSLPIFGDFLKLIV